MSKTENVSSTRITIKMIVENWGPFLFALIALCTIYYFRVEIADQFTQKNWSVTGLYSAIFGWAAIQTGFLFGVYGFIVGKTDGFIQKIKNTRFMNLYLRYIKRATIIGFALTIASIPLIIRNPALVIPSDPWFVVVAIWFSGFVWSFWAFLRVAYIFGIIARVRDKEDLGA